MNSVHATRTAVGADLVQLIVENATGGCGVAAGIMCGLSPSFGCQAFCVTVRDCISPNYTFGHEFGHLMGCNHAPVDPTGCGAFNYSFGYKDQTGGFRTIMAYSCNVGSCTRRLQWSNPNVDLNGRPTGRTGQENARSLNNAIATVASFRNETTPCPSPCVTTFSLQDRPELDELLKDLYDFRDNVLLESGEGQRYVDLFYRHAAEALVLVEDDESLRALTADALMRAIPTLRRRATGEAAWLKVEDLVAMDRVLKKYAELGSPGMAQDVTAIRRVLRQLRFYQRFGLRLRTG
jgi:hypothetical protein